MNFKHGRVAKVCGLWSRFIVMVPRVQIQGDRFIKTTFQKCKKWIKRTNGQSLHNVTWQKHQTVKRVWKMDKNIWKNKDDSSCTMCAVLSKKSWKIFYRGVNSTNKNFKCITGTLKQRWKELRIKMVKNWSAGTKELQKFKLKSASYIKLS